MMNPSEMANIARVEESLWWYRGMREISFALLDPVMASAGVRRALDAGCGTGCFAGALERRYGVEVYAIDLESEAMRFCRSRRTLHPARASIASLPFGDGTFDLVASMDVLVHFPPGEERAPFGELVRVLRPQGLLLVRVAALRALRSRHSQYIWEEQRFTRGKLEELARAHRLQILRLTYANFLLTPVALLKFRVYEPLTRQSPASGVRPLAAPVDWLLHLPLQIERFWLSRGFGFPWGQSLFLLARKQG